MDLSLRYRFIILRGILSVAIGLKKRIRLMQSRNPLIKTMQVESDLSARFRVAVIFFFGIFYIFAFIGCKCKSKYTIVQIALH